MPETPSLRDVPLFASVDGQTLQRLARDSKIESFDDGATIFRQGDRALCVVVVLEGYVKLSRTAACGDETLINICAVGESLYEALTPDGEHYRVGAEAIGDVCAMKLPATRFRNAMRESSSLAGAVIAEASRKVSALIGEIEALKGLNADQRLARFILSLCPPGEDSCSIRLPYDKRLIAARLGVKQETLSRAFAKLRDIGVRTEMRDVQVENVLRLAAECRGDGRGACVADRREAAESRDAVL
ncbi:Crp/Fnr family transcriptional regulator [Methylosinus sp. Sm6]|uniref:Crp/Fnr family transcriptional regulator n=1 Tax=Methylosinus sp. Sm6 TaxID=2866948 RepID=UPI001C99D44C|nr:Crp/Fnr family transcriptional regulator [Methylosinus sp. Sm6]MBY6242791.1 Crp/Fnr family transcriptional regulator [Methylosinus sp. Sm6]